MYQVGYQGGSEQGYLRTLVDLTELTIRLLPVGLSWDRLLLSDAFSLLLSHIMATLMQAYAT